MKTPKEMREEAERCVRLARQTLDDSVASALLAYACELDQRAQLLERRASSDSAADKTEPRPAARVA
jgi:hypothetical protein